MAEPADGEIVIDADLEWAMDEVPIRGEGEREPFGQDGQHLADFLSDHCWNSRLLAGVDEGWAERTERKGVEGHQRHTELGALSEFPRVDLCEAMAA